MWRVRASVYCCKPEKLRPASWNEAGLSFIHGTIWVDLAFGSKDHLVWAKGLN